MGPKKEVRDIEPDNGAKFADILVGQRSNPIKITVNLNCNVQILLDAAKKEAHRKLEEKVQAMKIAISTEHAAATLNGTQGSPADGEATAHPNEEIIQKLVAFQTSIKSDNGQIDLVKDGVASGCNQKLNAIAVKDVLVHNTAYVMGVVNPENTAAMELFIIEDQPDRPVSGIKKK